MSSHSRTSFLVISDTHDLELETFSDKLAFRKPTPPVDVLLHCGDLTANGSIESHQKVIKMLLSMPAELKLVIAGNHDVDLDGEFFAQHGGEARHHEQALALRHAPATLAAGIHLLSEGTRTLTLSSGAKFTIHASPWTPQHGESAF